MDLNFLNKILKERVSRMSQQTLGFMMKIKAENKTDMDVWNYAQPFYGKKLAFAFGMLLSLFR
jgi:hypothetical protein